MSESRKDPFMKQIVCRYGVQLWQPGVLKAWDQVPLQIRRVLLGELDYQLDNIRIPRLGVGAFELYAEDQK